MKKDVAVIAAFKESGEIKPAYIQLDDEEQNQQIIKIESSSCKNIENVNMSAHGNYRRTVLSLIYECRCIIGDLERLIGLEYNIEAHKWLLVSIK